MSYSNLPIRKHLFVLMSNHLAPVTVLQVIRNRYSISACYFIMSINFLVGNVIAVVKIRNTVHNITVNTCQIVCLTKVCSPMCRGESN